MSKKWLLILIIFVLACSFAYSSVCNTCQIGIIHYWDFQNASLNDTVGGQHGVDSGTVNTTGFLGNAREFVYEEGDKIDCGSFGTSAVTNPTGKNLSFGAWIKTGDITSGNVVIIDSGPLTSDPGIALYLSTSESVSMRIAEEELQGRATEVYTADIGAWLHVFASWNTEINNMSVYINGSFLGNYSVTSTFSESLTHLWFGTYGTNPGNQGYTGVLDEVVIYNRTVSAKEVADMFIDYTVYGDPPTKAEPAPTYTENWYIPSIDIIDLQNSSTFISWNVSCHEDCRNYTQFRLYNSSENVIGSYNVSITGNGSYTYNHTFSNLADSMVYYINASHTNVNGSIINSSTLELYTVQLANCSLRGYPTINFTMRNESSNVVLNGTMDFLFYYFFTDSASEKHYKNYSATTQRSNLSTCIFPNSTFIFSNITVDYTYNLIHYTYFANNINLSNITRSVTLYIPDSTSQIVYNVKNTFDSDLGDAFIHVQKYDVGSNTYKEVEVLKTDEAGNAVGRIELNTAWYRFWIYYHGELKLTEGPLKLTSNTKNFRLNLVGPDWSDRYENQKDISFGLTFNNATRNFRFSYSDPNLLISKACLGVQRINISTGNQNVSGSCSAAHSGTILGAIDGNYSGRTYIGTAWVVIEGDTFVLDILEQSYATEWQTYDDKDHTGVFITFLVVLAMVLIGIWHPVIAIILMLFGFGIMRGLGIHFMSWPMFVTLMIMGIVVLLRMGKQ